MKITHPEPMALKKWTGSVALYSFTYHFLCFRLEVHWLDENLRGVTSSDTPNKCYRDAQKLLFRDYNVTDICHHNLKGILLQKSSRTVSCVHAQETTQQAGRCRLQANNSAPKFSFKKLACIFICFIRIVHLIQKLSPSNSRVSILDILV